MTIQPKHLLTALLAASLAIGLTACGNGANEQKPLPEVRQEAQSMSAEDLRAKALDYKNAIQAKLAEIEPIKEKIKDIPPLEALGEEATALKKDLEALNQSISALRERFNIYYEKLKEANGDTSDLQP